jgi:aspartyl-tRNA(Asn)/glutamyl-tRNA(Gln) amidotransferase subunit C
MALSHEDVRKVALLARLELSEAEVDAQARHLNDLLIQFDELQQLDVTGIEPTSHSIPVYNVLRADEARASLSREQVLANAPEARDGCFIVPRILEG